MFKSTATWRSLNCTNLGGGKKRAWGCWQGTLVGVGTEASPGALWRYSGQGPVQREHQPRPMLHKLNDKLHYATLRSLPREPHHCRLAAIGLF